MTPHLLVQIWLTNKCVPFKSWIEPLPVAIDQSIDGFSHGLTGLPINVEAVHVRGPKPQGQKGLKNSYLMVDQV